MPHAWGVSSMLPANASSSTSLYSTANPSLERNISLPDLLQPYLAFDVHPDRSVYAYCSGNAIFTYDYHGIKTGVFLDYAYVPEQCSDIRFTPSGKYIMVTSRVSTRVFKCDPQCTGSDGFVLNDKSDAYVCRTPFAGGYQRIWGSGLNLTCMQWSTTGPEENSLIQEKSVFSGGLQVFSGNPDRMIYVKGTFKNNITASSWAWIVSAEGLQQRSALYQFEAGVQVAGPPAYNQLTRRLYVPVYNNRDTSRRLVILQLAVGNDGTLNQSVMLSGVGVLYEQLASQVAGSTGIAPIIPGFSVRMDTGALSFIDEQLKKITVVMCSTYKLFNASSAAVQCSSSSTPDVVLTTPYDDAMYKDLEFVGSVAYSPDSKNALPSPSKLFMTSQQDAENARAELYVQCAMCDGGGITSADTEALKEEDCFCVPGYMVVTSPRRGCEKCSCEGAQYVNLQSGLEQCVTGRELSMPGCLPCSATCSPGQYVEGYCDGTQTFNNMSCSSCTILSQEQVCPKASTLTLKRGVYADRLIVTESAAAFREDCIANRGLDCMRRQAFLYPFDGMDITEDIGPSNRRLVPVSVSSRSDGPAMQRLTNSPEEQVSPAVWNALTSKTANFRTTAALFDASSHEYFRIPLLSNMFDPTLAIRIVPSISSSATQKKIPVTLVWEQGMTLCMWYRFESLNGAWQTLFEMSNGYGTEQVYVQRYADTNNLVFGVVHSDGLVKKEYVTGSWTAKNSSVPPQEAVKILEWRHLCWTIRHKLPVNLSTSSSKNISGVDDGFELLPDSLFWSSIPTSFSSSASYAASMAMASYNATWDIYIDGGSGLSSSMHVEVDGVMPLEGSYSSNFVAYGTSFFGNFFQGSISDLRLYERKLDARSVLAIFSGNSCCSVFSAGSYIDASKQCTGSNTFNTEVCRACKSDCGPLHYIDNEDYACSGMLTADFTLCKPCLPCARNQYMSRLCSGTSFVDEVTCPPCKFKSSLDCPEGKVVSGPCQGNQIYDTSSCVDCNAECIGASKDPQGKGQFIDKECSVDVIDYICKPCSGQCPAGTFISFPCTGRERTDTGCTICKDFCAEGQPGVLQANGEYITGRCNGTGYTDTQQCARCKQCAPGYYPSELCDGRSFSDSVQCRQCITSCPVGQYLKGNCNVEEVKCVPCSPSSCSNFSQFLRETRACANGLNRVCEPTTVCSDAECPPGFYESATCTNAAGQKFCTACRTCSDGQYESKKCSKQQDRECTDCTSECPSASESTGIIGTCSISSSTPLAASNAVSCVASTPTSIFVAGKPCSINEWYVGTRTQMFKPAAVLQDTGTDQGDGTIGAGAHPFKSDFSLYTADKIVYLGLVGSTSITRQTWISIFTRAGSSASQQASSEKHALRAVMSPRANYFQRLDYYGASKNASIYPMASSGDWNANDVMLSYDEKSIYIFFSYTFDFIGKCRIDQVNTTGASSSAPYLIPPSDCSYLSPKVFSSTGIYVGVTGMSFFFKGCTQMFPMHYIACLYDIQGNKPILYVVDELRSGGPKTLLDNHEIAYVSYGEPVGRPRSPPTWDPVTRQIYYMVDIRSGESMGVRYVQVSVKSQSQSQS